MKNQTFRKICIFAGALLLIAAIGGLIFFQWGIRSAARQAQSYVHTIRSLLPEPQGAVPETRRDNTMAVLSIDGTDFVGLLEMPHFGLALPVCGDWGSPEKYPCRFSGSVYDRTLRIGATSQTGQFDFYREISVGDWVYFTDMEGNRYSYTVTDIRYGKNADQKALQQKDAALTLFIKNVYAFEYIIVFCDVSG